MCFILVLFWNEFVIYFSVQLLKLTTSVAFPCFALFAEVRRRFYTGLLVDIAGILCAVLTPMPFVTLTSPNVLHHSKSLRFNLLHYLVKVIDVKLDRKR